MTVAVRFVKTNLSWVFQLLKSSPLAVDKKLLEFRAFRLYAERLFFYGFKVQKKPPIGGVKLVRSAGLFGQALIFAFSLNRLTASASLRSRPNSLFVRIPTARTKKATCWWR